MRTTGGERTAALSFRQSGTAATSAPFEETRQPYMQASYSCNATGDLETPSCEKRKLSFAAGLGAALERGSVLESR
jgi:hypothetical protein